MTSSNDARKGYLQRAGNNVARSQGARSMSKDGGVNSSVEVAQKPLNRGDSKDGSLDPKQRGFRTPDTHKAKMDMLKSYQFPVVRPTDFNVS